MYDKKVFMNTDPLISIVTVSYNAALTIEATILSVIEQSYANIEYIIIDGGSTDGTLEIIKKYAHKISYWVSEPDKGIYDAMNKGIDLAHGEWINFMNAGDEFYDNQVLSYIFNQKIPDSYSLVYGKTLFIYSENCQEVRNRNNKYMPACHQSIFTRTSDMKNHKFDLKYKIAADYNYFYSLFFRNENYLYVDYIISKYDAVNGISSRNRLLCFKEISRIKYPYMIYLILIGIFYAKHYLKYTLNK